MTPGGAQDGAPAAVKHVRLLIVGPQGSGKGTQGIRIAEAFGIPAISTGDLFRANIRESTDLGLQVQAIIEAGHLVSDGLTTAVVRDRLSQDDAQSGFLLDGYPRNLVQVADLDRFLPGDHLLDAVIELVVPREESIARLARRAHEQGRVDDTAEAISNRLAIYESETAPILEVYGVRGIVDRIDGVGTLEQVTDRVVAALEARGLSRRAAA